jgi:hypothetical protein
MVNQYIESLNNVAQELWIPFYPKLMFGLQLDWEQATEEGLFGRRK